MKILIKGIALACLIPLSILTVAGCSVARSCAVGRNETLAREGAFTVDPDARIVGERVALRGSVVVLGNEPHTYAAFALEDGSRVYALYPASRGREAFPLQGTIIELTAILVDAESLSLPPAFFRDGAAYPISWKIVN